MPASTIHRSSMQSLPDEPVVGNYFVAAYPPFSCWDASQNGALEAALDRPAPATPVGLYIHVPFCPKKCDYCYYLSYVGQKAEVVDRYLERVVDELSRYAQRPAVRGRPVAFVYFGGGTPSTLSTRQLRRLCRGLQSARSWKGVAEVTFECAPRSVRPDFLKALREVGVTRLSMGVQSFDNTLLKLNGRIHLVADVLRAYGMIQAAGFDCVNLDLMAGLMGETWETWRETIRQVIALSPDSVTVYQTEIPHNTQLYRDLKAGCLPAPPISWPVKRARLRYAFTELEHAGYTVASAYSAVKDPQRHRFHYQDHLWHGGDMLGLGVASFGYFGGVHYQNEVTLEKYEEAAAQGRGPLKRAFRLSLEDQFVREFILQLKLGAVDGAEFRKKFGVDLGQMLAQPLRRLAAEGWLSHSDAGVGLTFEGLLCVDRLLPFFYEPRYQTARYT